MKIRIFTLAKELQLDSKVLIGYCQKVGIHIKDSALASISEEERDRVLQYMNSQGVNSTPSEPAKAAAAPTREPVKVQGSKVPNLRGTAAASKGSAQRDSGDASEVPPAPVVAEPKPAPRATERTSPPQSKSAPAAISENTNPPVAAEVSPLQSDSASPTVGSAPKSGSPLRAHRMESGAGGSASASGERAGNPSLRPGGTKGNQKGESKKTPEAPERPASKLSEAPVRPTKPVAFGKLPVLKGPSRPNKTAPAETPRKSDESTDSGYVPGSIEAERLKVELPPPIVPAPADEPVPEGNAPETAADDSETVTAPMAEETSTEPDNEGGAAVEVTAAEDPDPTQPVTPLRREDYIHSSGGSSRREMVAIGAVSRLAPDSKKQPKQRPMPLLPKLAAPPPSPKAGGASNSPGTGPAQKPDMRISRDMLERTPLHKHIEAHNQEKKRKGADEEATDEAKKPRAGSKPMIGAAGLPADRKARAGKRGRSRDEEEDTPGSRLSRHRPRPMRRGQQVQLKSEAEIEFPITIRGLSEAMGRRANELIGLLMKKGQMVTINSYLDEEQALELAMECGVDLHIAREKDIEEELEVAASADGDEENRVSRPAIVTILGHVDHGKTTLLDKIRSANVAAGEFGGITQHIAAYQVVHNNEKITFLDTPGHAAFAEMRARGANVTDIAILVVAANDGVMPQTVEALNHARAAGVPIVVAMNKVDLPDRNEQRVLQELATHNLLAAEWGGDTEVVRTSGQSGQGISDLLETIQTVAELSDFRGNPDKQSHGVCLEAFRDEGRGVLVWLIVQDGTLRKGDVVLCGPAFGRIRAMYDDHDREVEEAGPSTPVKVAGLDLVPDAGDKFYVVGDIDEARQIAETRRQRGREIELASKGRVRTLQEILSQAETGEVQDLAVILKADTPGSLEALRGEILKFQHPEVRVNVLHDGVGGVNESDVYLASASGAIVVAFHVVAEDRAEILAEREGVEIRQYNIIYEVTDDIKKAMEGLLKPQVVQSRTGRAIVLQTFDISRFGRVAGCRVLNGLIERSSLIRIVRDQRILHEYKIASLKRGKDDSKEVREGLECGIRLDGFDDVKEGDIFEAIKIEEVKRTL